MYSNDERSYCVDDMASGIRNTHDANHGAINDDVGLKEESTDDWSRLPEGDCTHRPLLQLELDLWQQNIPVS